MIRDLTYLLLLMEKIDPSFLRKGNSLCEEVDDEDMQVTNGEEQEEPEEAPGFNMKNSRFIIPDKKIEKNTVGQSLTRDIQTAGDDSQISLQQARNNLSTIRSNEEPVTQQPQNNQDVGDNFFEEVYVDNPTNISKLLLKAQENGITDVSIKNTLAQFRLNMGSNGIFQSSLGSSSAARIDNFDPTNVPQGVVSALQNAGLCDYNEEISNVNQLIKKLVSTAENHEFDSLQKTWGCEKVLQTAIKCTNNSNHKEGLKNALEAFRNDDSVKGKIHEGQITNIQALSLLLYNNQKNAADILGILNELPKEYVFLRCLAYIRNVISKTPGNFEELRRMIFSTCNLRYYTVATLPININDNAISDLPYNTTLDDPLLDESVEDMVSMASEIIFELLNTKVDALNKFHPFNKHDGAKPKIDYGGLFGKIGTNNKQSYMNSIFDFIQQLVVHLSQTNRNDNGTKPGSMADLYKKMLRGYFTLIDRMVSMNYQKLFKYIPFTDMFDNSINPGEYLNSLLTRVQGDKEAFSLLSNILMVAKGKLSSSKYQTIESAGKITGVHFNFDNDGDIEETNFTLAEFFGNILSNGSAKTQRIIAKNASDEFAYYNSKFGTQVLLTEEVNRESDLGEYTKEKMRGIIGNKSIDIVLRNGNKYVAIEYQGQQHYHPLCTIGFKNFGRDLQFDCTSLSKEAKDKIESGQGLFLLEKKFSDKLKMLTAEILKDASSRIDTNKMQREQFIQAAWDYLTSLVKLGILCEDENEPNWKQYSKVASAFSKRRWFEEIKVYVQQAADKQKFQALSTLKNWKVFYICPSSEKINENLISTAGSIPYVSDFSQAIKSLVGIPIDKAQYKSADKMVSEGFLFTGNETDEMSVNTFRNSSTMKFVDMKNIVNPNLNLQTAVYEALGLAGK